MYQIQTQTNVSETETCIRIQALFLVDSQTDDFSVVWGVPLNAQTLVLLLLELISPCLPHRQLLLVWQWLVPKENRQTWMGKMGYQFQVDKHCPNPLQDLPNLNECLLYRISRIPSCWYFVLQHWRALLLSFQMFPVVWEFTQFSPLHFIFGQFISLMSSTILWSW